MRKDVSRSDVITVSLTLLLVVALLCALPGSVVADQGKDYVIVIDVSTSMQDIFDEVKTQANRTLDQAQVGDSVAVITFGQESILLDRKQIRAKDDVKSLQKQVSELYPTDYATYLNRGLEKGLSELRYLFEKDPQRERVLLWLSDNKDNPPKELGDNFITLEKLREENQNFEPGSEWFAYNAPLKGEAQNENIIDFVTWARRTTFRVAVKEHDLDLGVFENGAVDKTVILTFEPLHPGAAGLEFTTGARVVDPKDPGRSISVTITPNRLVASAHLWQQEFHIAFAGEPGEYQGSVAFQPLPGALLDIEPRVIAFKATIIPPKLPAPVEPKEPRPTGLLADAKERGIIATEDRPPGTTRRERPLEFGPLDPGKKATQLVTLYLNEEADPKGITLDQSINLPQGFTIESKVYGKGTKLAAEVTVAVDQDIQLPVEFVLDKAYEGSIRFKSDEPGVEVLPVYLPIRITFNTDRVRWGGQILPQPGVGQTKARGMTFEELTRELEKKGEPTGEAGGPVMSALRTMYGKLSSRSVLLPILGAVALILILLLYRARPASELFVGELVPIKDPTNSNIKNIHLKRIGSLHNKDALTIGSSSKADIRLNHESVDPLHCRLLAKTTEQQTDISIVPTKGSSVKVNDLELSEKGTLSDKDLIGIGNFILLFSRPEPQKEIVAHFQDGRTMRGTPVTWNVGAPSFELLRTDVPGGEGTAEEITFVNFSDLKALFFLQSAAGGPDIPPETINTRELLEVTFSDGEKIEGHPLVDYSDAAARFYLIPREMPNIVSILVERALISDIARREAPATEESGKKGGLGGLLRKLTGASPAK